MYELIGRGKGLPTANGGFQKLIRVLLRRERKGDAALRGVDVRRSGGRVGGGGGGEGEPSRLEGDVAWGGLGVREGLLVLVWVVRLADGFELADDPQKREERDEQKKKRVHDGEHDGEERHGRGRWLRLRFRAVREGEEGFTVFA